MSLAFTHLFPNGSLYLCTADTQLHTPVQCSSGEGVNSYSHPEDKENWQHPAEGERPLQMCISVQEAKTWCESHCSPKFSVQTQKEVSIALGRHRIKSKALLLRVITLQCTRSNTRSFTGDVNSPHCYNKTGFFPLKWHFANSEAGNLTFL